MPEKYISSLVLSAVIVFAVAVFSYVLYSSRTDDPPHFNEHEVICLRAGNVPVYVLSRHVAHYQWRYMVRGPSLEIENLAEHELKDCP